MITFANKETTPIVKSMWKTCFGDTDEYLNIYFSDKYKEENTLIYWVNDIAVASLQMLEYKIRFYNKILPIYYLSGLCTLPDFRNKGYMKKLIVCSFEIMKERNIPISILVPAEEWLYKYYNKFNFEETFSKGEQPIELKSLLKETNGSIEKSFDLFNQQYQKDDFCVLKNLDDYRTIITEYLTEDESPKFNLRGMSAIINPKEALKAYASVNREKAFSILIKDNLTDLNYAYSIVRGEVLTVEADKLPKEAMVVSITELSRLLFGFKIKELPMEYQQKFEEHTPILNLMLE